MNNDRDQLCINTIRMLAADAVEKADSGHPGMPMGAAAMAYVLWTRFLRHNPRNPDWPDRDRFWQIVEDFGVTVFYTAPTAIRRCRSSPATAAPVAIRAANQMR